MCVFFALSHMARVSAPLDVFVVILCSCCLFLFFSLVALHYQLGCFYSCSLRIIFAFSPMSYPNNRDITHIPSTLTIHIHEHAHTLIHTPVLIHVHRAYRTFSSLLPNPPELACRLTRTEHCLES